MKKQILLMTLFLTLLMFTACQKDSEIPPINQRTEELKVQLTEKGVPSDIIEQIILSVENNEVDEPKDALTPDEIAKIIESENASSKASSCSGVFGFINTSSTTMSFSGINTSGLTRVFKVEFTKSGHGTSVKSYKVKNNGYFYDVGYLDCGTFTGKVTVSKCDETLAQETITLHPSYCF